MVWIMNESACTREIMGTAAYRRRLLNAGRVPGTKVEVERIYPDGSDHANSLQFLNFRSIQALYPPLEHQFHCQNHADKALRGSRSAGNGGWRTASLLSLKSCVLSTKMGR
jgi:hypothetical protein